MRASLEDVHADAALLERDFLMLRSIHRAPAFALVVSLTTLGAGAVAAPAQAASAWSAPITLPAAVGSGSFAENASGAQIAVTGSGPQVSFSATGQTWSAPVTVATGGTEAAVALAANGRAVVVWHGGSATAPLLQASTEATPGGSWSAPVTIGAINVGAQAPIVAIDGSGNAVVAWSGATSATVLGPIFTASLPAGGTWTPVKTLDATGSSTIRAVANATGSAIITWSDDDNIWADSGTILGGFATPVDIGHALAHYHSPRVSFVALNNAGQAVVAYTPQGASSMAATRSVNGAWSGTMALPCGFAGSTAIDGAGDVVVLCEGSVTNAEGQPVTTQETTRLSAGSNTWSTPSLLTSDFVSSESVVGDAAGTFIVALVTTATVNNMGVETVNAFTSPPGGAFGTATTFPVTLFDNLVLNIAAGRATLVWNSSSGAFESTEPVS
jgi:hypothetical protein